VASTDLDASQSPATTAGGADTEPRTSSRRRRRRGGGGGGGGGAEAPAPQAAPAPAPRATEARQRPAGDAARRKSDGKALTPRPWRDGRQRVVCSRHRTEMALQTPIIHRTGLAIRPLLEIARDGQISLVCDQVHPGPCEWPGEAVASDRLAHLLVLAPGAPDPTPAELAAVAAGDDLDEYDGDD
jgi:hypothetical protein